MLNLDDVLVFVSLTQDQNLSAAGRRLNMSTSSVSKRISRVEAELRAQLVVRSTRSIKLTPAGEVFFRECASLVPTLETATKLVQNMFSAPGGRLRIHTTMGIGSNLIAPQMPAYCALHPNVSIDLITHSLAAPPVIAAPDIVIGSFDLPQKMFERHELGVCHYVICASPDYLAKAPRLESYLDLPQHNCLLYFDDQANRPIDDWPFTTADGIREVHVTGCISSNNSASLCQLTVSGFGVALLPVFAVFEEIRAGRLVAVFTKAVAFKRNLTAFHHRSEHISRNLSSFLAFIRSHLEKLSLDDLVRLKDRSKHS